MHSFGTYHGFEIRLAGETHPDFGLFSIWKDGHHIYTLRTTFTESAAKAWIDTYMGLVR